MFPRSCTYEPYFPAEWDGLDFDTAEQATPKWYGVSFGDGNNGVSHMFADYYVRTNDPWTLARAAMLASFKPEWQAAANEAMEIDGEADYTISAVIYDPGDVDPSEGMDRGWTCGMCGHEWDTSAKLGDAEECPECGSDEIEEQENEGYAAYNGAWSICEVFPVSEDERDNGRGQEHDSLEDCFGADVLKLATED
jgi:hypothetical protein